MSLTRPAGADLAARLFGASPSRRLCLLQAAWPLAAGPELASRTEVVAVEGDTLRLRVADSSWRKELLKIRGPLLGRLRRVAGALAPDRLALLDGRTPRPRQPQPPPAACPKPAPPTAALLAAAGQIEDAEVRAAFLDSAARYLARFEGVT